jgi:hypothetical protein
MTHPDHGLDSVTKLHAELGSQDACLQVDYSRQHATWTRTQRTYRNGHATDDEIQVTIIDPVQDLISELVAFGGPVAIEVSGVDPQDLLEALRPALSQASIQINGQAFTV